MTVPTVACTNCGKNFTTDDLRGTSCKYCGTLLAHHARAAEQVAVVHSMLADRNGNGIPDAYEGMVANAQANAMNQAFGRSPFGPITAFGQPGANVHAYQTAQQVTRSVSSVVIFVVIAIALLTFLTMGIGFAVFFLSRG